MRHQRFKIRTSIWQKYYDAFESFERAGKIRRPIIPGGCTNNAHMFYLLFNDLDTRTKFISFMRENEIQTPFHYIPLHSAPAGKQFCKTATLMDVTNRVSDTLVRLPLYYDMTDADLDFVIEKCKALFTGLIIHIIKV